MIRSQIIYAKILLIGCSLLLGCLKGEVASFRHNKSRAPNFTVNGTALNGDSTNIKIHQFKAQVTAAAKEKFADMNPQVRLVVVDPEGKTIFEKSQDGFSSDWSVGFDGVEGIYSLAFELLGKSERGGELSFGSWEAAVNLDVTQPVLQVEAFLETSLETGARLVNAEVRVDNEQGITCQETFVNFINGQNEPISLSFEDINSAADGQQLSHHLRAVPVGIEASENGPFNLDLKCTDAAGNVGNWIQPIQVNSIAYNFQTNLDTTFGVPVGGESAVGFAEHGDLILKTQLLQVGSEQTLADSIESREAPFLSFAITRQRPESLEQINEAEVILEGPFASEISYRVLPSELGYQEIFFSLIRTDIASGSPILLGSTALSYFVESDEEILNWITGPQYVAASQDISLMVNLTYLNAGAPLRGLPVMEYTEDGETFTSIEATVVESANEGNQSTYQISVAYPFTMEKPFRLRATFTDILDISTVSSLSPNLAGSETLNLAITSSERENCFTDSNSPGARLAIHLASKHLCRKTGADQVLSEALFLPLFLQNRGQENFRFYETQFIEGGMGYRVVADGSVVTTGRLDDASVFGFTFEDTSLYLLQMDADVFQAQTVELQFDVEATGSHSTENFCYDIADFPSLVIQDKNLNKFILESPFSCE